MTVSSQLQLEALACSLGSVYTTNKSFRSEHSTTNKHLSEFTHLEIEACFITLDDLMQIGEDYIKYIGKYLMENCLSDIDNLGKFISPGLKDKINHIINSEFERIKYKDAIELAQKFYPGWICRFYIDKNSNKELIDKIKGDNVEVVLMEPSLYNYNNISSNYTSSMNSNFF